MTYHPGGLSSGAVAVHLVVTVLTCGLWLPFFLLHWLLSRGGKRTVTVPMENGAAVGGVTPPPQPVRLSRKEITVGVLVVGAIVTLSVGATVVVHLLR